MLVYEFERQDFRLVLAGREVPFWGRRLLGVPKAACSGQWAVLYWPAELEDEKFVRLAGEHGGAVLDRPQTLTESLGA